MNNKFLSWIQSNWLHVITKILLVVGVFLLYAIPVLPSGLTFSANEVQAHEFAGNIWNIWNNPSYSLWYFPLWVLIAFGLDGLVWARLISALFATLTVILAFYILRTLFSQRIAVLGTILMASSAAMLHSAHLGTPDVMVLFAQVALFTSVPLYRHLKQRSLGTYLVTALFAVLIYIPGMVWLVVAWLLFQRSTVAAIFKRQSLGHRIGLVAVMVILLAPALVSSINHSTTFWQLLAIPQHLPTIADIAQRAQNLLTGLVWRYPGGEGLALFRAPILTLVEAGLLVMGIAAQFKKPISRSNVFILFLAAALFIFVVVGGLSYIALMPVVYVLIASGLYFLLSQWHDVFPNNSFARLAANLSVLAMILLVMTFHGRAFFIAWPHSPTAHRLFTHEVIAPKSPPAVSPSSFEY